MREEPAAPLFQRERRGVKKPCDPGSVFIKAGEAPIKQIGAQLLFEPSKRPAFEMLEHNAAQQTVGRDGGAPKIHGALAAARQCQRASGYQPRIIEQQINLAQGRVLKAGEFFEESKAEERRLALKGSNHYLIDILDYVKNRNHNL